MLTGISTEGLLQSVDLAVEMCLNEDHGVPASAYFCHNLLVDFCRIVLYNNVSE